MASPLRKDSEHEELDVEKLSKKYPLFRSYYNFYLQKYNNVDIPLQEALPIMNMSNSGFHVNKISGVDIPCYSQKKDGADIYIPIICLALFKAKYYKKVKN